MSTATPPINGTATSGKPGGTAKEIARYLRLISPNGEPIEIRSWLPGSVAPLVAFFTSVEDAAKYCEKTQRTAEGVYTPFNPFDLAVIEEEKAAGQKVWGTSDRHIIRRAWMLVDCDSDRESGLSATDDEKSKALEVITAVRDYLAERGWPEPVFGDSGNGYHAYYAIELPNDDESRDLVKRCLHALGDRFDVEGGAKIDRVVYNASRIAKVLGTAARKGQATHERPHRTSALIEVPNDIEPVTMEQLQALAVQATPTGPSVFCATATNGERPDAETRASLYLNECDPSISGKGGHKQAFKVTCTIGPGFNLSPEVAFRLLWDQWNPRCQPPWSEKELRHKVSDAYAKESRRGWKLEEDRHRTNGKATGGFGGFGGSSSAGGGGFSGPNGKAGEGSGGSGGSSPKGDGHFSDGNGKPEGAFEGFDVRPEEPRKISTTLRPVPVMTPDMLPLALRGWLVDVANRMQCPLDYFGVGAIVSLGAVLGRRIAVRPKAYDDWTVPLNLWGGIVGRPGVMKSAAMQESMWPLRKVAAEADARFKEAEAEAKAAKLVGKAKIEAAKDALKKAAKPSKSGATTTDEELVNLAKAATPGDEEQRIPEPRYIVNDPTVEKLGEILSDNPKGVLLFRDELTGWLKSLDKIGHEQDAPFYLEAWNGTNSYTYDRIGRGKIHIEACCLSILGGIQPGPLNNYIRAASGGMTEADNGLVQRLQVVAYPDSFKFDIVDRPPNREAKNRAYVVYEALDQLDAIGAGAALDEWDPDGIPYIRFSPEAQEMFFSWLRRTEDKIRSEDETAAFESHLAKYRSLFPKLAGIFHLVNVIDRGDQALISPEAAMMAERWCDYLEEHARRIYESAMGANTEAARHLGSQIKRSALKTPFTVRDVYKKDWEGLKDAQSVEAVLAILEEFGWVRPQESPPGDKGGRPTVRYHINPKVIDPLFAEETEGTPK